MKRARQLVWLLWLVFPLVELGSHFAARRAVALESDWRAAAAVVRAELREHDLITSAPSYTDPLLRLVLGDVITPDMAGRSDQSAYARLWVISSGGARAPEAPARAPSFERKVGKLLVQRFELPPPTLELDLSTRLTQADVSVDGRACPWRRFGPPRGGGLGFGALPPVERFQCGKGPFVAKVVLEDLSLRPRACVLQPPGAGAGGGKTSRVLLRDVPLAERIFVYAGLYYEDERMRRGAPVKLSVLAGDQPLATLVHKDGDGFEKLVIDTRELRGTRTDLAFEVSSKSSKKRSLCWAASVQREPR